MPDSARSNERVGHTYIHRGELPDNAFIARACPPGSATLRVCFSRFDSHDFARV